MPTKFSPGQLCMTPGAMGTFSHEELYACLNRHLAGDWGDLSEGDKRANDRGAKNGDDRLISTYVFNKGEPNERTLWILTEEDRSVTTLLLPSEN